MAIVTTDDRHYKAIADTIRENAPIEDGFTPAEMAGGVSSACSYQYETGRSKGFEEGRDEGLEEGVSVGREIGFDEGKAEGIQTEYDRFWDALQENGNPNIDYRNKFWYWPNAAYKPKYPIYSSKTSVMSVFANARIENTIVDVDFSGTTNCTSAFSYCSYLHTIPKLIVSENNNFNSAFQACSSLVNITVEGVLGYNGLNFQWSTKLSKASITSIVNALSSTTSGLSVTFSKTAVNNAFNGGSTGAEWTDLANTKSNWTINLV